MKIANVEHQFGFRIGFIVLAYLQMDVFLRDIKVSIFYSCCMNCFNECVTD